MLITPITPALVEPPRRRRLRRRTRRQLIAAVLVGVAMAAVMYPFL